MSVQLFGDYNLKKNMKKLSPKDREEAEKNPADFVKKKNEQIAQKEKRMSVFTKIKLLAWRLAQTKGKKNDKKEEYKTEDTELSDYTGSQLAFRQILSGKKFQEEFQERLEKDYRFHEKGDIFKKWKEHKEEIYESLSKANQKSSNVDARAKMDQHEGACRKKQQSARETAGTDRRLRS